MKRAAFNFLFLVSLSIGCQNEKISFSPRANETFYVDHMDSKMRVQVRGNTRSDKIIVTVHGGPGGSSYYLSNLAEMKSLVEPDYAVAYWDQPLSGGSQANRVACKVDDIADGLRKVIQTLRHRYGQNKEIILFSESWGGLITAAFLLDEPGNQSLINGWINSDGPHDFNLMDREVIRMAIRVGEEQIALGRNVSTWTTIVDYCRSVDPAGNYEVSRKLNELLGDAEYLIEEVVRVEFNTLDVFRQEMFDNNAPFTALGLNLISNGINEVEKDAYTKVYASRADEINVPMLLLWGRYDFIAPPAVADSLFTASTSQNKKLVILERSGHNGFLQEPEIFWREVTEFLDSL